MVYYDLLVEVRRKSDRLGKRTVAVGRKGLPKERRVWGAGWSMDRIGVRGWREMTKKGFPCLWVKVKHFKRKVHGQSPFPVAFVSQYLKILRFNINIDLNLVILIKTLREELSRRRKPRPSLEPKNRIPSHSGTVSNYGLYGKSKPSPILRSTTHLVTRSSDLWT